MAYIVIFWLTALCINPEWDKVREPGVFTFDATITLVFAVGYIRNILSQGMNRTDRLAHHIWRILPKSVAVPDEYANPDWQLTVLTICVPVVKPTETLSKFSTIRNMNIKLGQSHRMKVQFNNGAAGKSEDLIPELTLILEW